MNAGHKRPRRGLNACPRCGSYSGERRSADSVLERHMLHMRSTDLHIPHHERGNAGMERREIEK